VRRLSRLRFDLIAQWSAPLPRRADGPPPPAVSTPGQH